MSYEQECIDYELHGDPRRDAFEYEENARFDQFDGRDDPDPHDDPGCVDCGFKSDCAACKAAIADLATLEAEFAARDECDDDDVPF